MKLPSGKLIGTKVFVSIGKMRMHQETMMEMMTVHCATNLVPEMTCVWCICFLLWEGYGFMGLQHGF